MYLDLLIVSSIKNEWIHVFFTPVFLLCLFDCTLHTGSIISLWC